MAEVAISITNRIASASAAVELICNNPTDTITFTFDDEWDDYDRKIARFAWDRSFADVPFEGTSVKVPEISGSLYVFVGVYADGIASTPVKLKCKRSILCIGDDEYTPPKHTYWDNFIGVVDNIYDDVRALYEKEASINLFNKNSTDNISGKFVHQNGTLYDSTGYVLTHLITVLPNSKYYISVNPDLSANYACCYYNVNEDVVTSTTATKSSDNNWWISVAPPGAQYMRVSTDNNRKNTLMVVKSETQPGSTYVPFYEAETGVIPILTAKCEALANESTFLKDKKLSLNGDSICYGAGSTGGYGAIIAERCGMTLENKGISGATITAGVNGTDGTTPRHWVCRTISTMDANADFVILEGGVNDASLSVPMGTLNLSNYTATLDDTTYCGAFESMLKQAVLRFTKAKIFYLAVHKMTANFNCNNQTNSYYYNALALCKKWGVTVIDCNVSTPPLGMYVEDENLVAMRNTYTHNGDGWHPNEAGYKRFYIDKIIAAMKNA